MRCSDGLWARFETRCLAEDPPTTKSAVLLRFIEDYADGILNMPTAVMVYDRDGKLFAGLRFPDEATQ